MEPHQSDNPSAGGARKAHPALWLFVALVLFTVIGATVLLLDSKQPNPTTVQLPDGTSLTLQRVGYGTDVPYEEESWYRRFAKRFAPNIYLRTTRGSRTRHFGYNGSTPKAVFFVIHEDPTARHSFFHGGQTTVLSAPPHWSTRLHSFSTIDLQPGRRLFSFAERVPVTRPDLLLSFWTHDAGRTTSTLVASFPVENSGFTGEAKAPPPTPMPLALNDGVLSVTLLHIVTGTAEPHYSPGNSEPWDNTWKRIAAGHFFPSQAERESHTIMVYSAGSLSDPSAPWQIQDIKGADRFGNPVTHSGSGSRSQLGIHLKSFSPSLVPEAGPFDLELEFNKDAGFSPDELFVVDAVIPTTGSEPLSGARATVNGCKVHFEGLAGPDYQSTGTRHIAYTSQDHPVAVLEAIKPPGKQVRPRLVKAVDDRGTIYTSGGSTFGAGGSSGSAINYACSLEARPSDWRNPVSGSPPGTSITLTFALPTSRFLKTQIVPVAAQRTGP